MRRKRMRKLSFLLFFILVGCAKSELQDDFRKVIVDYQKTYPVKNPRKGNIYVYSVHFLKEKNDTIFRITRSGAGIPDFVAKDNYTFGAYSDSELKNLIVLDSSKLSSKLIINYKRVFPDSLIWSRKSFPESVTPLATYKLKNGVPEHVRTDTIWNHWD